MRLADLARLDTDRGAVVAQDWRAGPAELWLADAQEVAAALAGGLAADAAEAARLGLLGLALAARAWRGRPSDAARGALIQAAELIRAALSPEQAAPLAQALAQADAASLAGADPAEALLALAEEQARLADRADERCGRHAAGLLDAGEAVLALPLSGRATLWMLRAAGGERRVLLPAAPAQLPGAVRLAQAAPELGAAVVTVGLGGAGGPGDAALCVAEAARAGLDGSALLAPGGRRAAESARVLMPVYALAPAGPDPAVATLAGADVAPPELISAVVTSRGIYRAAMLARHLGDADVPPDVIPLL